MFWAELCRLISTMLNVISVIITYFIEALNTTFYCLLEYFIFLLAIDR